MLTYIETNSETGRDIGVLSIADNNFVNLFATEFSEDSPAVSPNGRFIAFSSTESDRGEVYVSPFPNVTENRWQISRDGGLYPAWSRDGTELFFLAGDRMMRVPVELESRFSHGMPEQLFRAAIYKELGRHFSVHPDGQSFVAVEAADTRPTELVVVENWLDELEERRALTARDGGRSLRIDSSGDVGDTGRGGTRWGKRCRRRRNAWRFWARPASARAPWRWRSRPRFVAKS